MRRSGAGVALTAAALSGVLAGVATLRAQPGESRPYKSVYGTLDAVVEGQRAVVMRSDAGERLVWRFSPEVVSAAGEFEPGDEMIVIYRETQPNQKVVTALAFPGTASVPTYVNLTGERVVLRSGPKVDGSCGAPGPELEDTPIVEGGQAETGAACWCCAPDGQVCTPANETGLGRAFLVRCFR